VDERTTTSGPHRSDVPGAFVAVGVVVACLGWLAVTVVARARWFDLRCYRLDESSTSMRWVGWFPPHVACLDAQGQVLVRDYSESVWLAIIWVPVVAALVAALVMARSWRRRRRQAR
jgi:hypothetical protein